MTMQDRVGRIIDEYASQGIHRTGTEVDHLSADWLKAQISGLGVEASETSFPFRRVQPVENALYLQDLKISGVPLYDCRYTGPAGLSGTLGELGSRADIGVIMALPYAASAQGQRIHAARLAGEHQAIVIVTDETLPSEGAALLNAEHFTQPFGPPVLQVANAHWSAIKAARNSASTVTLKVDCRYVDAVARNIGARISGSNPALAPLVIMTPRSGWWACASERGGGIACFLEMMRALRANQPQRDIIFTANTGHELGHTGLDHYLHDQAGLIKSAHLWVHLGANFAARYGAAVRLQYSDQMAVETMAPWLKANRLAPASQTLGDERPLGEARNIFDGGGRYISILGSNGLFHHPADVWPNAVDLATTSKWVNAFVQLGIKLSGG